MAEKKLEVKDLTISFKTTNGKVQAVRDVSFDLYSGETLAIVGESGSGKSVTSRAIMGILAGNAIKEGGKILYGDKDLMKTPEEEFHKVRGDKIAMVFQDPLSSLNPIMRIGKQLTEAMLLKNKASRKQSRKDMNTMFNALGERMRGAGVQDADKSLAEFKKFVMTQCRIETAYSAAYAAAQEADAITDNMILYLKNKSGSSALQDASTLIAAAKKTKNHFVVDSDYDVLVNNLNRLKATLKTEIKKVDFTESIAVLTNISAIVKKAVARERLNTFTLGYYLTYCDKQIPDMETGKLNAMTRQRLDTEFMNEFLRKTELAAKHSMEITDAARRDAIAVLTELLPVVDNDDPKKAEVIEATKKMKAKVAICIDPLEVDKDSLTYTFPTSMDYAIDLYFGGAKKNAKEERRYNRSYAKHEAIIARGKTPDWEVIPASYVDLDAARRDIADTVKELIAHMQAQLDANANPDFAVRANDIIDFLKEKAQDSVNKITRGAAREKAIKLMESVGIDDPRRRFKQYPFEFSGGMRQRIVIAIALTANPDILICDEPTTALDVTIQAQILELINKLKKDRDLSVIFITHDLGVVANMADRVAVMYAGKIVEYGTASDIFYNPAHPYTWALLSSVPDLETKEKLESIPGTPPNMIYPPKGDAFAARNKYALKIDFEEQPPMFKISDTHYSATWLLHPNAPHIDPPKVITERIRRMHHEHETEGGENK